MKILESKSVIITGAAGGLGLGVARECLACGARVTLVDCNETELDKTVQDLRLEYPGAEILKVVADVSREEQVKAYVDQTLKAYGRIDGLYNNAGIEGRQAPVAEYKVDIFKKVVDINLMGVYYGLRYVLPVMKAQGWGRVVNVSSVGGVQAVANQIAYSATKSAVSGMTRSAALDYGQYGVLTNAIAPGLIVTPMAAESYRQIDPVEPEKVEEGFAAMNPMKRLGKPEEVGKVVTFLLSDACSYINGQVIVIDGGQTVAYFK